MTLATTPARTVRDAPLASGGASPLKRRRGRRKAPLPALAPAVLIVLAASCRTEEPSITVGGLAFPAERYLALAEPERHGLADLLAFGAAVAREEVEELGAPVVDRALGAIRVQNLPFHLAAERMGYDEAVFRAAYAERPEWELVVRHVVRLVPPNARGPARDSARSIAAEVAARARAGQDFGDLAARYSEEPGAAERGGRLQPGRQGSWVDAFWNAALGLAPGQVSAVVETEYGFHVLRLDERRPVPFEEADRSALLRWVVPSGAASEAMDAWMAGSGAVILEADAVERLRSTLLAGGAPRADERLAAGAGGERYEGRDFAAGWARLSTDERQLLERGEPQPLAGWLFADAREAIWAEAAGALGVPVPPAAASDAARDWSFRALRLAQALGFGPALPDEQIRARALDALLSGAAEQRAARLELRSLRPLLRQRYPVEAPTP